LNLTKSDLAKYVRTLYLDNAEFSENLTPDTYAKAAAEYFDKVLTRPGYFRFPSFPTPYYIDSFLSAAVLSNALRTRDDKEEYLSSVSTTSQPLPPDFVTIFAAGYDFYLENVAMQRLSNPGRWSTFSPHASDNFRT
jgi:hypothetical protein